MNPFKSKAAPIPRPSGLVPLLLVLLTSASPLVAADVWPEAPPAATSADETLRGEAAADYRYAAALYRALTGELESGNPALLTKSDAARLARALLVLGQGERAEALLHEREDLPLELTLQLALQRDPAGWSDLETERWRGAFTARDGESLYWRGRLAAALGEIDAARLGLEELLRREPGSVFAPPALELLQELNVSAPAPEEASGSEEEAARKPESGLRVQWGVFRDARGASRQRDAVQAYGQDAELIAFRRDGAQLFRVCSPVQENEEAARALGEVLLRRYGLEYVLLRPDPPSVKP